MKHPPETVFGFNRATISSGRQMKSSFLFEELLKKFIFVVPSLQFRPTMPGHYIRLFKTYLIVLPSLIFRVLC